MNVLRPLFWIFRIAVPALIAVLSAPTFAEPVRIGGVGSVSPVIKLLGAEYAKKNKGFEFDLVEPPIGTKGGIRALAAGKLDIVLSGRAINPDETGVSKAWLNTPLVLATNGGKSKGLTREQIAELYAGRNTQWDDGKPIRLVLRGDQETETKALRSMSPAVDAAVSVALKNSSLPMAENDLDAIDSLARIPGSVGTSTLGLLKASGSRLTVLPIDGVVPDAKAAAEGKYAYRRDYFLITGSAPRPDVATFVAWLGSPAALAIVRKLDYLPSK